MHTRKNQCLNALKLMPQGRQEDYRIGQGITREGFNFKLAR